jgi:hypothetical protein
VRLIDLLLHLHIRLFSRSGDSYTILYPNRQIHVHLSHNFEARGLILLLLNEMRIVEPAIFIGGDGASRAFPFRLGDLQRGVAGGLQLVLLVSGPDAARGKPEAGVREG